MRVLGAGAHGLVFFLGDNPVCHKLTERREFFLPAGLCHHFALAALSVILKLAESI